MSSEKMTIYVRVEYGIIATAPPIARKFIGQPLGNLKRWMEKQGGYRENRIHVKSTGQ